MEITGGDLILFHNLLLQDADSMEADASKTSDADLQRALLGYAKYRRDLAAKIYRGE